MIHLELADLVIYQQYLHSGYPLANFEAIHGVEDESPSESGSSQDIRPKGKKSRSSESQVQVREDKDGNINQVALQQLKKQACDDCTHPVVCSLVVIEFLPQVARFIKRFSLSAGRKGSTKGVSLRLSWNRLSTSGVNMSRNICSSSSGIFGLESFFSVYNLDSSERQLWFLCIHFIPV